MNDEELRQEEAEKGAQSFAQSMSMAEMALFETITGTTLDEADSRDTLTGMATIAAKRLGVDLTAEETHMLTITQIQQLLPKAAAVPPPVSSEKVNQILSLIAGK